MIPAWTLDFQKDRKGKEKCSKGQFWSNWGNLNTAYILSTFLILIFLDYKNGIVIMHENVLILRRYMVKYHEYQ